MKRVPPPLALAALVLVLSAHVGSPDTYFEGSAGPYPIRVIVRSPGVVPGLAQISVRILGSEGGAGVRRVTVLPVRWDAGTEGAPPADLADSVPGDPALYSAALWLMTVGSYSVHVAVEGTAGSGTAIVPVQAIATRRLELQRPLGFALLGLGAVLFIGALTIIGAAVRESVLPPGEAPDPHRVRRARITVGAGTVVLAGLLFLGRAWWTGVDAEYRGNLYRPFHATASVHSDGAAPAARRVLRLALDDSAWLSRRWTPLVPDHGRLMHLFLVGDGGLDAFAHLHPVPIDSNTFDTPLPPLPQLPAGRYRVYADIVHESGFAQTLTDTVELPATEARGVFRPGDPDDAWWTASETRDTRDVVTLSDGSTMTWERGSEPLVANADAALRFVVRGPRGEPAELEPYMGMTGHTAVTREDGAVFVHLHPLGTISWAAQQTFLLRGPEDTVRGSVARKMAALQGSGEQGPVRPAASLDHGPHRRGPLSASSSLSFPYAFPQPGRYRIWVQVKRHGRILTGAFEAEVS
ncbi:MAG: hypothetical protein ACREL9_00285 [Gemmatimonadales bacterium]